MLDMLTDRQLKLANQIFECMSQFDDGKKESALCNEKPIMLHSAIFNYKSPTLDKNCFVGMIKIV